MILKFKYVTDLNEQDLPFPAPLPFLNEEKKKPKKQL